ncbi:hypothetical protein [Cellulomonas sp. PSBB021]|uniref:hypothetical protein n=1 Tax=Cellulomonas sp. PSBB021 TaxID=2003551 RepID=UPI000B8DB669|nr:hypothetical protein [Cellulomonas sp. PSBB021]ASR53921.1 hypothetical protein CBP52_00725 [Cellulomonas sp. PSBB021]ASR56365.1 hypothetical protein CBP52_16095 [Cellulomonas sp. PSBB021]
MDEAPSERLVDQRVRNRAIEVLEVLADGDAGLYAVGVNEYFNHFFDYVDDDLPHDWRGLSTYTQEEVTRIELVLDEMLAALKATANLTTEREVAASGWPKRIAPIAREALGVMTQRGRFDEEREEVEPSHR